MSYNTPGEVLTDIANSIRTLYGSTSSIPYVEMPGLIKDAIGEPIDLSDYNGTNWIIPCAEHFDFNSADDISGLFRYVDYDTNTPAKSLTIRDLIVPAANSLCTTVFEQSRFAELNLIGWKFPSCSIDYMFWSTNIYSLDLTGWDTSHVTSMYNMFQYATITKMWLPSTFVATSVTDADKKPFKNVRIASLEIYTDATDAATQGWGTIDPIVVIHYNSTYQDFINA